MEGATRSTPGPKAIDHAESAATRSVRPNRPKAPTRAIEDVNKRKIVSSAMTKKLKLHRQNSEEYDYPIIGKKYKRRPAFSFVSSSEATVGTTADGIHDSYGAADLGL